MNTWMLYANTYSNILCLWILECCMPIHTWMLNFYIFLNVYVCTWILYACLYMLFLLKREPSCCPRLRSLTLLYICLNVLCLYIFEYSLSIYAWVLYVYLCLNFVCLCIFEWNLTTLVVCDPKAPFQLLPHRGVGEGATSFLGFFLLTLDPHFMMLSVKQGLAIWK